MMAAACLNENSCCFPPREFRNRTINGILLSFGNSAADNVLEYFQGTPDIITNVMNNT